MTARQMTDQEGRPVFWDREETLPVMVDDFLAVCRTSGCGNSEIPLLVTAVVDEPSVFCGVCASPITDLSPLPESE